MKVQGKFKMQAHICRSVVMDVAAFKVSHSAAEVNAAALRAARARSKSIGALDDTSRQVQKASTQIQNILP